MKDRKKLLFLLLILKWKILSHRILSRVLKQELLCWLFKRLVYMIMYLSSTSILQSSNEIASHCPLHIISSVWLVHTKTPRPFCDNVDYIAERSSNGSEWCVCIFPICFLFAPFPLLIISCSSNENSFPSFVIYLYLCWHEIWLVCVHLSVRLPCQVDFSSS
jgi:hypothetical protein